MLQIQYKNSEKRPLWLVDAKYTIGSDTSCEIPVEDSNVAACQAEMEVSQDSVLLRNLGDAGLVLVNGEALKGERQLVHGDELTVGDQVFSLVDPKQGREAVAAAAPEPSVQASVWSLKAMNTALANRSFPIDREVVIGRSNECDITLGVAHLSRRHARLSFSGENLEVEDLRSSNGTYVNGKQVQRSLLRDGDELSFDTLTFLVNGPQDDSDSTMLRPQADLDKTNVRPAIKVGETRSPTPKPRPQQRQAASPKKAGNVTQAQPRVEESNEGGSMKLVIIGVVVVALVAAGYFLFLS